MANKKVVYVVVALIAIVIVALAANYYIATPQTGTTTVYKYDTGLTVSLKVNNVATSSLVTDNAKVQFFPLGTDPVGVKTFKESPTDQATYSATAGAWQGQLDAGSYVCLVYSTNDAFLPKTFTVTVPGTNDDGKTVWATPGTLSVSQKANITGDSGTPTIKAIADADGVAITPVTTAEICVENATEWKVTYTINIEDPGSAPDAILPDSIFYLPSSISGLSVVSATVNGEDAEVTQNTAIADGPVGYQIAITGTNGVVATASDNGQIVIVVDIQASGVTDAGSLQAKLFVDSDIMRTNLRWWAPDTNIGSAITIDLTE